MENRIKIYLDTSVINFVFAEDAPDLKDITIDLFENYIGKNKYKTYISDFVLYEIEKTPDENKKVQLINVIKKYNLELIGLEKNIEISNLAKLYIEQGIIPRKSETDAFHIAVCVVNNVDYLISWNYKHLANINKEKKIKELNMKENYHKEIRIITPLELLNYED